MSKRPKSRRRASHSATLIPGNIYAIDWSDHFFADKVPPEHPGTLAPLLQRTYGRYVADCGTFIQLQTFRRHDNAEHSVFGIIKSAIIGIHNLGADPAGAAHV